MKYDTFACHMSIWPPKNVSNVFFPNSFFIFNRDFPMMMLRPAFILKVQNSVLNNNHFKVFWYEWSRTAKIFQHLVSKTARKNQSVLPAVLTFASSSNSKAEVFVKSTKFWTIELLGHEWSNNLSMKLKTFFLTLKLGVVFKLWKKSSNCQNCNFEHHELARIGIFTSSN